jgi:hypothetical protein
MLDDLRRQDLYPVAAAIVGTAGRRAVERGRINHRAHLPGRRAAPSLATPEAAGAWAARTALEAGAHDEALSLVDELVALRGLRLALAPLRQPPARSQPGGEPQKPSSRFAAGRVSDGTRTRDRLDHN